LADQGPELRTERLWLRRWRDADREPFATLNADPVTMEHFLAPLTRQESDAFVDWVDAHFREHGFGLWVVEVLPTGDFAGLVGLMKPAFEAHFTPAVEVGWRLARQHWGRGYATEAAKAALEFGFDKVGLEEIVSFTVPANLRSRRVMDRLGMSRDPADDFDHPRMPEGHRLRRHVLYRLSRDSFRRQRVRRGGRPSRT
jgi:RimJ/RimL family protein N-acetyltransferase